MSLRGFVRMGKILQEKLRNVVLILRHCVVGSVMLNYFASQRNIRFAKHWRPSICRNSSSRSEISHPVLPASSSHINSLSHPARQHFYATIDELKINNSSAQLWSCIAATMQCSHSGMTLAALSLNCFSTMSRDYPLQNDRM